MTRKVVFVARSVVNNGKDIVTLAVCDDGTMWERRDGLTYYHWRQVTNVPQPEKPDNAGPF